MRVAHVADNRFQSSFVLMNSVSKWMRFFHLLSLFSYDTRHARMTIKNRFSSVRVVIVIVVVLSCLYKHAPARNERGAWSDKIYTFLDNFRNYPLSMASFQRFVFWYANLSIMMINTPPCFYIFYNSVTHTPENN